MTTTGIDYFSRNHPLRMAASRISLGMRCRIFDLFMETMHPTPSSRILDVGVTPDRTLPESNFFEKLYPYRNRLVATSIEDVSCLNADFPGVRFVKTGKFTLPFSDGAFDVAFCSAVLEHVGCHRNQILFIREVLRVSRRFFITTPNRQFPFEFHTFLPLAHWLPQGKYQSILRLLGMEFWSRIENLNLLTPASLLRLFPPGIPVSLRRMNLYGFPSNLVVFGDSDGKAPILQASSRTLNRGNFRSRK